MNTSYIILIVIWAFVIGLLSLSHYMTKVYARRHILEDDIKAMGAEMAAMSMKITVNKLEKAINEFKENPTLENKLRVWYFLKIAHKVLKVHKI